MRFYEKEELVTPKRDKNNIRQYTEENKLWEEFLLNIKETGMSLIDLKRYKELWELGDEGTVELIGIFIDHRVNVMKKLETYQKLRPAEYKD
ncbi:MerR family transcriptional regulator [Alteribacillus bidgolensis]|uniref:MerR family transcriptional regulator n=1 Tax=Alteribacillus bidgolensis TaxID=930129 RepID=UPI000B821E53|nr:MerR family transcriptional regulator [Alteribacillus bidgolensis]